MLPTSLTAIDTFVDALWLEDGLSRNTLAAYRRDLTLYAQWLAGQQPPLALDDTAEHHLQTYFAERHAQTRATSANRRLTVLRRYFHWAVRERRMAADPTVRLQAARQPLRVPKTLSQAQVEALLNAPDLGNPLGLRQGLGHAQRLARGLQPHRGVGRGAPLAQRPVKVAAQHREAPVGRGGARLRMAGGKVGLQVVFGRVVQRQGGLLVGQPLRVQRQVAPVGGQRVARQAVLQPQGVHKGVDGVQTGCKHPKTIACIAGIQLHRHKKAARRRLGMEAVALIPASASA